MRAAAPLRPVRASVGILASVLACTVLGNTRGTAQERGAVTGRVLSTVVADRGEPVPGVDVRFPRLGLATVSDGSGRFAFPAVPQGSHEVRAELLGCLLESVTAEVRGGETTSIDLTVARPVIEIPGLVATGVSREPSDADRPYSVGRVDAEERRGHPGRSIADLIRGELPGVHIVERGQAGEEVSIQLRGPTSISGSQEPLIVIDGVITTGGFVDLNPNDVANVRVLKGAAAAAEYGARGAAGVIEVMTIHGGAPPPALPPGPLVLIDGEVSNTGLAGVDSDSILNMQMLTGAGAAVLFGAPAETLGVLRITTRGAAAAGTSEAPRACLRSPG